MQLDPSTIKVGASISFNKDIISEASDITPETVWAKKGQHGKVVGTERPGNQELFWVSSLHKPAFLTSYTDFTLLPA